MKRRRKASFSLLLCANDLKKMSCKKKMRSTYGEKKKKKEEFKF